MARRSSSRPAVAVQKKPATAPQWLRPAVLALSALLFVASTSSEVADYDFWWHLKTGQYIVQHHSMPVPDPFSFTTYAGKAAYPAEPKVRNFNLTHEWLAQVFFDLTYAATGFAGIVLLRSALIAAYCGLLGLVVYYRTRSFYRALGAAIIAGTVAWQFVADRPYLITFAFLAAAVAIAESRRWLWVLPPSFLVWSNCHSGYFLGWVVLGIYCAESLYQRRREKALWIATAASVLASGLNPNGFLAIPVLRWYRSSYLQSTLNEWKLPLPWPPTPFIIVLAVALVVLLWQRRGTRPVDWLLFLAFAALAMSAARNIIFAAVPGAIIIGTYLPWNRAFGRAAEFGVAGLLLLATGARMAQGKAFQFRAADWKFCGGAADFLLSHRITAPMFNTYEMGGYLIWRLWPQERVFIDGRALNEFVFRDYQRIAYNADATNGKSGEELLKEYGIEVIVMNGFEYTSGSVYLLPAALSDPKQTEWKLVYQDAQAMVYMRHPPAGVTPLNSFDALAGLEQQCTAYVAHDPGRPRCALGLADLFGRIGDPARARQWQAFYATHAE